MQLEPFCVGVIHSTKYSLYITVLRLRYNMKVKLKSKNTFLHQRLNGFYDVTGEMMASEGGLMYGDEQYMNPNMMQLSSLDSGYPHRPDWVEICIRNPSTLLETSGPLLLSGFKAKLSDPRAHKFSRTIIKN